MLNTKQIEIIKFYEGDVIQSDDPILSDPKAYVTWNALFFSDAQSEKARAHENRPLNKAFLYEIDRVIDLTKLLLSCMQKTDHELHVKRVDRLTDYQCFLKQKRIESFLSTSTAGFLNAYRDKQGLVLMDIVIPKGTKCIDFSSVLDSYQKKEEKEILLPPYLSFEAEDLPMDPSVLSIHDRNDEIPKVYCKMQIGQYRKSEMQKISRHQDLLDASLRFYDALNHHASLTSEDERKYILYKQYFQQQIQEWMDTYE